MFYSNGNTHYRATWTVSSNCWAKDGSEWRMGQHHGEIDPTHLWHVCIPKVGQRRFSLKLN